MVFAARPQNGGMMRQNVSYTCVFAPELVRYYLLIGSTALGHLKTSIHFIFSVMLFHENGSCCFHLVVTL